MTTLIWILGLGSSKGSSLAGKKKKLVLKQVKRMKIRCLNSDGINLFNI